MPQVIVPPAYQGPTRGCERIDVEGRTVAECIDAVEERYPGFRCQVFDASGRVHRFVQLFVNGDEIDRGAVETAIRPGDRVEILAAVAGG